MTTAPEAPVLNIGETIGHFEITRYLGAGGMGEVYQARDSQLKRMVAIKVLHRKASAEETARFEREGLAAAALRHPNIVTVHEVGQRQHADGTLQYLVMEFIEGESLRRALSRQPDTKRLLGWINQVAEGLAAAHRANVVHRDLKPENIMITADGRAKIVDFGLAKYDVPPSSTEATPPMTRLTQKGQLLGTYHYMSPEQAKARAVDHRSDIFSFGTILYEATEGRQPFVGASDGEVLREITNLNPDISSTGPVRDIITKCLKKDPQERYQDAGQIAKDLSAIIDRTPPTNDTAPIVASPLPTDETRHRSFIEVGSPTTNAILSDAVKRERKRRRLQRAAASIAVLVLLSSSLWAWDYYRLKVGYFANIGTRWGAPEGVGALDAEIRRGREFHFQFEVRRHKVRRILRLNSADQLRDDTDGGDGSAAIQKIFYREDGTVQQIDLRDHNEKLVMRQTFSERRETDDGDVQYVDFHAEHQDEPLALDSRTGGLGFSDLWYSGSRSEITAQQVLYDSNGRTSRIIYLNAYRQNRPNAEGIFGQRLAYEGPSLLPNRIESLGHEGIPSPGRNGLLSEQVSRNPLGDLTGKRYLGVRGEPVLDSDGCQRKFLVRDVHGNVTEFSCFGIDDEPTVDLHGAHKFTHVFDARGNLTEWAYFGVDGKPTVDRDGVHKGIQDFDARGNLIDWSYFGINGKPAENRDDVHKVTQVFDARGNAMEQAFFGTDSKPTLNKNGFHMVKSRFDARGNVTEETYFGIDGKPTVNRDGVHMVKSRFDPRDKLTVQSLFGIDGKPAVTRDGVHRFTLAFDARGNLTKESFFGIDGKPTVNRDGVHRFTLVFDVGGNLTRRAIFGTDGKPVLLEGVHSFTLAFDVGRNLGERALFGIDGKPTLSKDGFHKDTAFFDARGNVTEEAFFGIDGKPTVHRDGYHKRTYVVDALGNRIELASFGMDGKPTVDRDGVHRVKSRFDTRGNVTEEASFGIDGEPTVNHGAHKTTRLFDSQGNMTELAYFGLDGKPLFAFSSIDFALRALAGTEVRFTQRFTPKGFTHARVESGIVVFGPPPQMRWSYQAPEPKLFVFDGQTSWFYVEEDRQATIGHVTESGRAALPFLFLSDSAWMSANYAISGEKRGSVVTTRLKANKTNVSVPEITIDRDARDGLIRRIEYLDRQGNRTAFELSEHRKVPAPATLFQFTPPKGVQVVTTEGELRMQN